MLRWISLASALAACTYPEKEFSPPFGCIGDPSPTTKKQSAVIGGFVVDAELQTPVQGVSTTLLSGGLAVIDGPKLTASAGQFDLLLPLMGTPFERAYVKAEAPGFVTSLASNSRPITDDFSFAPLRIVSVANAAQVATLTTGETAFAAGTGTVFATVRDCNDAFVAGATITTDRDKRVFYFSNIDPSNTPTATTEHGIAMIADLTEETVTLTVTVGEETYRPQTYRVVPDTFTQFDITP